jgi:hypothetical protein
MARDEQEPLAALAEAAELAAVVRRLRDRVAVRLEQPDHLVEHGAAARRDPRHVLPQPELERVVLPRLERQPQPAQRELVQRLILREPIATRSAAR